MRRFATASTLLRILVACSAAFLAAAAAQAMTLDEAKASGSVGEGLDGYVHLVDAASAPADVKALVDDINNKRKARYQEIATERGVPLSNVAALAGAKLIERAPAGEYVRDSTGTWKRK